MIIERPEQNEDDLSSETEEEEMRIHIEGSALNARQQRAVLQELPKSERGKIRRVLSESVPPEGKEGIMSYMSIWELTDGRWMIIDVMLGGLRNASTIKVAEKRIAKGNTEVSGVEKRASILMDTPEHILNPLVMPGDVFLRLHRRLAYKLIELSQGNNDYAILLTLPIWTKFPENRNTRAADTHESIDGIESPKKADRDAPLGDLGDIDPDELERRHRNMGR